MAGIRLRPASQVLQADRQGKVAIGGVQELLGLPQHNNQPIGSLNMNTVIIINLNGNAFHLEEPGFQALRAYLERAQGQLKDNPDKAEIMADLEQAIADKCAHFLRPHKNVLIAAKIDGVLKKMGRVQPDGDAPAGTAAPEQADTRTGSAPAAPKRLYQIR